MEPSSLAGVWTNPWVIGVGVALIAAFIGWLFRTTIGGFFTDGSSGGSDLQQNNHQNNNQNVTLNFFGNNSGSSQNQSSGPHSVLNVLFIDDDTRFKIVNILKKHSWINCQIIKDLDDFNSPSLVAADVIFIDIEGVGKILMPQEQGLGIVREIKTRYPEKHVVIYSSQTERDMTHPAFRMADGILRKDAQPSEFLKHIEDARK